MQTNSEMVDAGRMLEVAISKLSDAELKQVYKEFMEHRKTGVLPDDAFIRKIYHKYHRWIKTSFPGCAYPLDGFGMEKIFLMEMANRYYRDNPQILPAQDEPVDWDGKALRLREEAFHRITAMRATGELENLPVNALFINGRRGPRALSQSEIYFLLREYKAKPDGQGNLVFTLIDGYTYKVELATGRELSGMDCSWLGGLGTFSQCLITKREARILNSIRPIPKIGEEVFVPTAVCFASEVGCVGGLARINKVSENMDGTVFISVDEHPGTYYNSSYLAANQDCLKEQFGKQRAYRNIDNRVE